MLFYTSLKNHIYCSSVYFVTASVSLLLEHPSYKLHKKRFYTDTGKYVFSNRVVDVWNRLPNAVVSCNTVTSFKCMLDHVLQHDWGLI
jgi:hypothetical protein